MIIMKFLAKQHCKMQKRKQQKLACEAGAIPDTIEIIDVEDVPLAYYPGNTCRVKVRAAGDLGRK